MSTPSQKPLTDAIPNLRPDAILMRLFEVSPDPITVTECDTGRLVMCNEEFCRMTAYTSAELQGKRALDLALWESPAHRQRYTQLAAQPGGVRGHAALFTTKDGRKVPVVISAATFEQDGARYFLAVLHDETERERRRLQHEAVLSSAMVGIACTRDRIFQLTNARYEQMFGWGPGSLIGMPGSVVWPSTEAYDEISQTAGPVLARGEAIDLERELARRDGSRFWARLRARAVDPQNPMSSGTIWIIEDVTERRRNEQALAAAKEQAEAANLAKSQFLANTSHEIRTPLNGLLGLVRLALTPQGPAQTIEQLQYYLARIQDSALVLADIISDILDFSKIEAGHLTVDQVAFDLHALLASIRDPYAELARARGLGFRLNLAPNLPVWVCGDPLRLRQILGNYLSNALKFSDRGMIEVEVTCAGAGRIRIEVIDHGLGIEAHVLPRLFEPFSQADTSATRRFGGTGLGLSICRQLAGLMGGTVGVRSQVGEGSIFWVELPLPLVNSGPQMTESGTDDQSMLRGSRVLLVEDNPVNTLVAEATLHLWGIEVTTAINGADALDVVNHSEAAFDAVLMDLQMPVMGGLDAAQLLRQRFPADELPIIALTAGVMTSEREAALAAGMNDFLTKPIDPEQLARVLAQWVLRARSKSPREK